MSEEMNTGIAVPGEEAPPQIVDTQAPLAEPDAPSDAEVRARALGWAPKEEFRGPAEKWVDAETFVKRGEEHLPILRENLKRVTDKLTELERRDRERDEAFKRVEKTSQVALERQREQLIASYEAAKRNAVSNMDTNTYDQLARDQHEAIQRFDQHVQQQVAQPQQPNQPPPEVNAWRQANPWFDNDPTLNYVAQGIHIELNRQKPGMPLAENLREVEAEVRRRFPEKFGIRPQPQRQQINQSAVEGGERIPVNGQPRRKGAGDLPAEARKAAESFIRQGLFKDMNDYANTYWSQN